MGDALTGRRAVTWQDFTGPNFAYLAELYDRWQADPNAVDPQVAAWLEQLGPPPADAWSDERPPAARTGTGGPAAVLAGADIGRIAGAMQLLRNLREYGHLEARIDPLAGEPERQPLLDPASYALSEEDLTAIPAQWVWREAPADVPTAREAVRRLRQLYTGTLAYEFAHVHNVQERAWLTRMVESGALLTRRSPDELRALLRRLIQVEDFERFLHRTFPGQKRFSIEGVDMLVPMLDELIERAVLAGARTVMIGMAHRGRLNVLAHVLGKPYAAIFAEFHASPNKELVPSEGSMGINYGWTGDVKYHLGAERTLREGEVVEARLVLANNPSHLEFVNPVVEGFARAAQDDRGQAGPPRHNPQRAMAVLVHGDAAFPGEGIVAETLNLSRLAGYQTGGTVHIIANNRLGFTAVEQEGRSTRYASDLAKGFEIPIVHVSADDPEACLAVVRLAQAYRQEFGKDFLIDLVGYRRWGHNEADDPVMTQPRMYSVIERHPTVRAQLEQRLLREGVVNPGDVERMKAEVEDSLREAYNETRARRQLPEPPQPPEGGVPAAPATGVPLATLRALNDQLLVYPPGFHVYPKLDRILQRRRSALDEGGRIDWGHAETLAFASLLAEGVPIRLTGQDSERGTFGQRHLVLHDVETGATHCPLQRLPQAQASFAVHNSPLTEAAVMGFEYGYSVEAPETLVLWEAQFGDFANAGQVIIDQFIASGRAKWAQSSGLVLLLPHGYEGQGPEHSSARLERYLQLSAEHNWCVANPTTSAQYFHLLRRQALWPRQDRRPLVIMTPKSLLRNPRAASPPEAFADGSFSPVLDEPLTAEHRAEVERLVLCSGKVAIDLQAALEQAGTPLPWLAAARIEQLYPFPEEAVLARLARYPRLREVVWLQEEPRNMGAWSFVAPILHGLLEPAVTLRYVGRPARSSPAEGMADDHDWVQRRMIQQALSRDPAGGEAGQPVAQGGIRND
ncbi:MAG: 2-oxoglutarate dehydrogenase E1 component [Alicyclobacillaceae bacterium]|nr:2-oxoglutarate dehydrogenase E1 component [Alicyclobacillaceae bacterium]